MYVQYSSVKADSCTNVLVELLEKFCEKLLSCMRAYVLNIEI